MSGKRKDNKGRVLKTGESQRKDLLYQYRYTDNRGKRHTIYNKTLQGLREKKEQIQKDMYDGIDYSKGVMTVSELAKKYLELKRDLKPGTIRHYEYLLKLISESNFGSKTINSIKQSDAKKWFIELYEGGLSSGTISGVKGILQPAFEMACEEDVLRKNPFNFGFKGFIPNGAVEKVALTEEQMKSLLEFVKRDNRSKHFYDLLVVLFGSGLRISEAIGLTIHDLDFENRIIHVTHQLQRNAKGVFYVSSTKSKSGIRDIPMTDEVYKALEHAVSVERCTRTVDGYNNFLFATKRGELYYGNEVHASFIRMSKRFNQQSNMKPIKLTPHICRHTFCTLLINAGIDVKSLQYLMGHSNVDMTLNVYTHATANSAKEAMLKIWN